MVANKAACSGAVECSPGEKVVGLKNRVAASTISLRLFEKCRRQRSLHPMRLLASINQLSMHLDDDDVSLVMEALTSFEGYGLWIFDANQLNAGLI